jgi:HAD superfamily hydrolase (TIGR01549 family)
MTNGTGTDWSSIRLVILDVDGTLYRQTPLRMKMLVRLVTRLALSPKGWKTLKVLHQFRKMRETIPPGPLEEPLESYQYHIVARALNIDPLEIRRIVAQWIHQEPLPYLRACMYPDVHLFLQTLQEKGIAFAFYSDYPLKEKLEAMGIPGADAYSSEDDQINRMKPDPAGLEHIRSRYGFESSACLMIGDRYEKDGQCAAAAGMLSLILDQGVSGFYTELITDLKRS